MKRFALVLIVAVVATLVVVAPASAETLHGQWTGGVASGTGGTWDLDGLKLQADPTENVVASGLVNITTYSTYTDVASLMIVTADPYVPPFPAKMNSQAIFAWGPATQKGAVWTVSGVVKSPTFVKFGLEWGAVLVADTDKHTVTMTLTTTGSYWGWKTWTLNGELF